MLLEEKRPGSSPYKNEPRFQMVAFRGILCYLFCQPEKMGFRRHCQHGSHSLLEQAVEHPMVPTRHRGSVLPLVFSTRTLNSSSASRAVMCHHWPLTLFQHSPQIHRDEESKLLPNSENTGSYVGSIIFQVLLRELLQEAQFPKWDVSHAPGDCGN